MPTWVVFYDGAELLAIPPFGDVEKGEAFAEMGEDATKILETVKAASGDAGMSFNFSHYIAVGEKLQARAEDVAEMTEVEIFDVRDSLRLDKSGVLSSIVNGASYRVGAFALRSVASLKKEVQAVANQGQQQPLRVAVVPQHLLDKWRRKPVPVTGSELCSHVCSQLASFCAQHSCAGLSSVELQAGMDFLLTSTC